MPKTIDRLSQELARSGAVDGYSLWRALKSVNDELFLVQRQGGPIPVELLRLRAIIIKAREYRRRRSDPDSRPLARYRPRWRKPLTDNAFDPFDIVDHYRALGGTRQAVDVGGVIEIVQGEDDWPEAAEFWARQMAALNPSQQKKLAVCLLERGRY